jgi:hypothetical protein
MTVCLWMRVAGVQAARRRLVRQIHAPALVLSSKCTAADIWAPVRTPQTKQKALSLCAQAFNIVISLFHNPTTSGLDALPGNPDANACSRA